MLHSIVAPNIGYPITHQLGEGAAVWGQAITPSIAHLVQLHREITISYSRVRPGIIFEAISAVPMLPHIVDASTFRLHVDASSFRHTAGKPDNAVDAVLQCEVGDECTLRMWGRVSAEDSQPGWDHLTRSGQGETIPVLFHVSFWEISRAIGARMRGVAAECAEKDRKIRELEMKVALFMCAQ